MKKSALFITIPILSVAFIFSFAWTAFAAPKNTTNPRNPHYSPSPTPTPTPSPMPSPSSIWGAYTGNNDQTMATFEAYVGKPVGINAMFWGWDSPFPQTATGSQGKTLLIFWEPSFGFDEINSGRQDSYITQFALGAKSYGYSVILSPFDEFNLNEAPWGNNVGTNTSQSFILAWKHVRNIFTANNVTNVKFALSYNNTSIPSASYTSFYPGDAYVDYVGVDGFNFGTQTFSEVFSTAISEAKTFGKPVWVLSTGSIGPKSQFILDLGSSGYPWIWFNRSPYNIDSESITAFKSILP